MSSAINLLPEEDLLHILSYLNNAKDHINFTSVLKRPELRYEYHKYPHRKHVFLALKNEYLDFEKIDEIRYIIKIINNKNNLILHHPIKFKSKSKYVIKKMKIEDLQPEHFHYLTNHIMLPHYPFNF